MASRAQRTGAKPGNRKFIRDAEKPLSPTPSPQKEMSHTTKQRLASTRKLSLPQIVQPQHKYETSHHKVSAADSDHSSLQPCPPEMVFQNYTPGEVCEMPLVLRNRDVVPQLVKVTLENSPYFQVVDCGELRKVPPGLSTTFRVLFSPLQNKDYFHQLLCITEKEQFIVPIRAIGARAILDFPDQLDFLECPVKYSTQKTLLVHNVGNRPARYQLSTQSPFSVSPAKGTLGIGEVVQVTVKFHPLKTGDYSGSLRVHCDTGEDTHTSLHGTAVSVHIRLDRNKVTFGKMYITLSNCATVHIHNQSDITAHFQWKAFATQKQENQLKLRHYPRLCQREKNKLSDFLKECGVDTTQQERSALLAHTLQSERAKVQGDPMLFSDDIFSLEPKEGEIRPYCSAEISVLFKPQEARVYKKAAYCDISGLETRLPLLLTGEGIGPQVHFSFEKLYIGEVSFRATHSYEAILLNKAPVEASFSLVPPTTAIGSCFTFLPQEGIVAPEGLQAIRISFHPIVLGEFEEEFCFHVTESPKPVTLTIGGCVTGPNFHFDVPALHFGDVSFGFPHTLRCCLTNASLAPMTFNLCIPEDGSGKPSVHSSIQTYETTRQSWRKGDQSFIKPREFTINPCRGTIQSLESQDIEVTLCSNTVREYKMQLVVDVDGVGMNLLALTLTARCIVPSLRVLNPVVTFGHCCLMVPYDEKLTLMNDSNFPGCYCFLPQEHKEMAGAQYFSSAPSGIIKAHSLVEIPVTLKAHLPGECSISAEVAVFGRGESPLEIRFEFIGQGPAVYVYPRQINFGSISVLEDSPKTLHLSNQSDVPAVFWVEMACKHSHWRVEPSKGVVLPNSEVSVIVTANLNDTGKFQDEVKVFIKNSPVTSISVQAVGVGTTIVTDKPFAPEFEFKPHFSLTTCRYQFKMINKGWRIHQLYWTTEGFRIFRQDAHPPAPGGTKNKATSQSSRPDSPVFKLQPLQMDLRPGQTVKMVLEGCSKTPQVVKERLLCYATVGKETAKKQIMEVDVICKFILPAVEIPSRAITFRVEKKPSDVLTLQYKPLSLKNTCSLPLSVLLELKQPFLICNVDQQPLPADSKPMTLDVGEELNLCIQFNPAYEDNLNSRVADSVLRVRFVEHPHEEQITVRGEVYFPNLHLQTNVLDFGCIMNDTEQVLYLEMTNYSPIAAQYHWSFQTDSQVNTIRFRPSSPKFKPQPLEKEEVLPRKHSTTGSVEEPTKALETMQDSGQEGSAQEGSDKEGSAQEDSAKENSAEENSAEENSAEENSAEENSAKEHSTEEHSTEEHSTEENSDEDSDEEDSDEEDSDEEDSDEEDSDEEDFDEEDFDEQDSDKENSNKENFDEEDSNEQDPAQQLADAEDSLEAEELSSTSVESQSSGRMSGLSQLSKEEELSFPAVEPQRRVRMRGLRQFSSAEHLNMGMEEVFNVLPLWGVLQPGESQLATFTFFGHANIMARVTALCHVEGGPTYEVVVTGEASWPSYQLDVEEIDWGLQIFNEVLKGEVTLRNTGVVEFTYVVPNSSTGTAASPLPGVPVVVPTTGSLAPGKEQVLKVYFLPGRPRVFCRTFQVQVAHLEPAEIHLKGEGTFPVITMNLPWMLKGNEKNEKILKKIQKDMRIHIKGSAPSFPLDIMEILQGEEESLKKKKWPSAESFYLLSSVVMGSFMKSSMKTSMKSSMKSSMGSSKKSSRNLPRKTSMMSLIESFTESSPASAKDKSVTLWKTWLQMEIEKKLIEDHVLKVEAAVTSRAPEDRVFNKQMRRSLVNIELPEYKLKMGKVPLNKSVSRTVTIRNPGEFPVSFQADGSLLRGTGFSVNLDQVQGLKYCHSYKFKVHFDSANRPLGKVDALLPIKVAGGCTVFIHFYATVTDPSSTKRKSHKERQKSSNSKSLRSSKSGTADLVTSPEDKETESPICPLEDKP